MQKFFGLCVDTIQMLKDEPRVIKYAPVGSALYLDEAKDLDFLVLVDTGGASWLPARWWFDGFTLCGGEYDDQTEKWGATRKGLVNLIITVDPEWYSRMLTASAVCEALKLTDKGDRIVVHRVVRDGYDPEAANARRDGTR
jgi:hypothetical protein